jgi:hypothetical protein
VIKVNRKSTERTTDVEKRQGFIRRVIEVIGDQSTTGNGTNCRNSREAEMGRA